MKQGFPEVSNYKVMVQCITYNQSKYIEETLKGFAMQNTDFSFICCVFDDASTDGEQDVLKRWIENHCKAEEVEIFDHPLTIIYIAPDKDNPNCIYAIHLQKVNTWGKPEKREMIAYWEKQCEYEALCEGDDYWIDPLKLQKQVNFMDTNPDYSMCFHKSSVIREYEDEHRSIVKLFGNIKEGEYTGIEILEDWIVPTASVIFRKKTVEITRNANFIYGDIVVFLSCANFGRIYCLGDTMSVYRRNISGISNSSINFDKLIKHYDTILYSFGEKYKKTVINIIAKIYVRKIASDRSLNNIYITLLDLLKTHPNSFFPFIKEIILTLKGKIMN